MGLAGLCPLVFPAERTTALLKPEAVVNTTENSVLVFLLVSEKKTLS